MHIVIGREIAEELREKYTVLELEAVPVDDTKNAEAFCVIPVEKIAMEMQTLEQNIKLHNEFVQAIKDDKPQLCLDLAEHLKYKFGGELDTFYDIIVDRCKEHNSTKFVAPAVPAAEPDLGS